MNVRKMIDSAADNDAVTGLYQPPRNIDPDTAAWLNLQNIPIERMRRDKQLRAKPRKSALDAPLPYEGTQSDRESEQPIRPNQAQEANEEGPSGKQYRQIYSAAHLDVHRSELPSSKLPDQAYQIGGGRWVAAESRRPSSRFFVQATDIAPRDRSPTRTSPRVGQSPPRSRSPSPPPGHDGRESPAMRATQPSGAPPDPSLGEDGPSFTQHDEMPHHHHEMPGTAGGFRPEFVSTNESLVFGGAMQSRGLLINPTPPSSFFATQELQRARGVLSTPPMVGDPMSGVDRQGPTRRGARTVIGRSNKREAHLGKPFVQIHTVHEPKRAESFESVLSVVDDYRQGRHTRYIPVDCTQYLDNLPDPYTNQPRPARSITAEPLTPAQRWSKSNRLSIRALRTGRTPRPTPRPIGGRRKDHHLQALPHRKAMAMTAIPHPQRSRLTDARSALQTVGANVFRSAPAATEVAPVMPSKISNAIPLLTPGLKSTRRELGRNCFVFDSAVHQSMSQTGVEEDTFYVAYSGNRPSEADLERVLTKAIQPPGMMQPHVTAPAQIRPHERGLDKRKPRVSGFYEPWGTESEELHDSRDIHSPATIATTVESDALTRNGFLEDTASRGADSSCVFEESGT